MSQPDASLEAAIRTVAAEAAPQLWRQALEEARVEVRQELRRRLVGELWAQLDSEPGVEVPADPAPAPAQAEEPEPVTAPVGPDAADRVEKPAVAGLYLYGFTHSERSAVTGLSGVDDSTTFTVAYGPISAVVSEARGTRHGWGVGGDGEPDLTNLAPRLRQHEQVLQAALSQGGVLPVRFGTLYPTEEAVLDLLRSRSRAVDAALRALDGKAEWGLTVRWDPHRLHERGVTVPDRATDAATAASGRAYLDQVARDRAEAERVSEHRRQLSDLLHRAFTAASADGVVLPPRRDQEDEVLMRASYLVANAEREPFQEAAAAQLAAHAELDLSGDLTGPWPPYHFAHLELEGASA